VLKAGYGHSNYFFFYIDLTFCAQLLSYVPAPLKCRLNSDWNFSLIFMYCYLTLFINEHGIQATLGIRCQMCGKSLEKVSKMLDYLMESDPGAQK